MLFALLATQQPAAPVELFGKDCGLRIVRCGTEYVEEIYAVDAKKQQNLILVSPTHPAVRTPQKEQRTANLLSGVESGLFQKPPTFAFSGVSRQGNTVVLKSIAGGWKIEKRITVPKTGNQLDVRLQASTDSPYPQIRYLLNSYAFAPGAPDTTWTPAIRPQANQVIGDHFFRAPVVMAQKGRLAGMILPNLDVLTENRPIPTIIDLDCKNGVVDAPLLSYGFADHKLVGHVYFANDASMVKPVPWDLRLGMKVLVNANAEPNAGYREAAKVLWDRYGHRYFDKVLPQAMPFADYARVCYPAAFNEKATGGWFEHTIDGVICGGMPSGWGLYDGWVSWQCWFNQLRSAWGLRWWGKKLGEKDWVDKADKMLNLALAAPMKQGAVPTTYLSRTKEWKGSLITPSPECYYDLTNMAWKGIWMLKWLEFEDCPRKEEVWRQVREMSGMMIRHQNSDGSFPTWLTKDLKVVPILDRSAQSALPAWFLGEYALSEGNNVAREIKALRQMIDDKVARDQINARIGALEKGVNTVREVPERVKKASAFLEREIIPRQRYYDFETFFSCSPKQCLQRNGVIDDLNMWDLHTMQAPQNTLSMQWCAEAVRIARSSEMADMTDRVARLESTLRSPGAANFAGRPNAQRPTPSASSLAALDIMSLYQNVWPISYRKVAYTYGGFGVQNSDGEYNDARQAQFGATLCDFGAQLGRRDYFERGVAAIRASLTLINHPLHEQLGIYPNPNYPLGLQPENDGHGGTDQQNGRTGFDWGEGSGLAAAAEIMDKYGSEYTHKNGWKVQVDGQGPWLERHGFDYPVVWSRGRLTDAPPQLWLTFMGEDANELKVTLRDEAGVARTAEDNALAEQLGDPLRWNYSVEARDGWPKGRVVATVDFKGRRWTEGPFTMLRNPTFDMSDWRMPGWTFDGNFLNWPTRSTRLNFNAQGKPFIGTCEDGKGGFDDEYTGTITSPKFIVSQPTMMLLVGGGAGAGVYVELLDENGKTIYREHGRNRETMDERTWDVSRYRAQPLQIRIVDQEKGGWGHINLGQVRTR